MGRLRLKVCGLREPKNIVEVARMHPDFMGFIFYKHSPRRVHKSSADAARSVGPPMRKVGVFVNARERTIGKAIEEYELNYIQLHGDETPRTARAWKDRGLGVIKTIAISHTLPPGIEAYQGMVDYLLFDAATQQHGGGGRHFHWEALRDYTLPTPFFLAGGIALEDVERISQEIACPQLAGLDVNSRFETTLGVKDLAKIEMLLSLL